MDNCEIRTRMVCPEVKRTNSEMKKVLSHGIKDEGVPEKGWTFVGVFQEQPINRLAVLWPKSTVLNGQGKDSENGSGMGNGDERQNI